MGGLSTSVEGGGGGGRAHHLSLSYELRNRSNLQVRWVKHSVGRWRTAAHPLFRISVAHPQASSCLLSCDRRYLWSYRPLTSPFSFCALCCCRQCTRDIAQSSFGEFKPLAFVLRGPSVWLTCTIDPSEFLPSLSQPPPTYRHLHYGAKVLQTHHLFSLSPHRTPSV